jgi:hypothetical protein
MQIRFEFNNSEEGIKNFFETELKSLVETLSMLFLTGWDIDSIDLPNKLIHLKQNMALSENILETEEDITDNKAIDLQETRTCEHCIHYNLDRTYCKLHEYSTRSTDTCKLWSK